ncbi:kinase-like protein [Daedalea quercina L-15889]|uniref:Kinase-like protein n=1 Tax=Daedalea quercina L-15889 TaxID=1314783 RepID=A0A165TPX9_9APHY|nr:kinase-like protein [Daedalea quercina L-15889]
MGSTCVASYLPDFTGKLFGNGRYECTTLLGAGAAGVVYLALDHHAPTSSSGYVAPVQRALKIIQKAGPLKFEAQRREISLHQLVSDVPHVLKLHDTFEDAQYFYLVMDYHESDLFKLLCHDESESPYAGEDELVRSVFVQILDAVHACHERGVFHRDIKPENILCNADGSEVYIADFGLGTQRTLSYTFGCGTWSYMSPECIGEECEHKPYSTRHGDIWALGVLLVNMTTGLNPWEMAVTADDAFGEFLVDDEHFEQVLPVSKAACSLLKQIFSINPLARPTIPELRERILELPTFFPSKKEDASAKVDKHMPTEADLATTMVDAEQKKALEEDSEVDIGTVNLISYGLEDSYLPTLADSVSTSSSSRSSPGPATPDESSQSPVDASEFAEGLGKALWPLAAKARKSSADHASPALNVLERLEMLVLE